MKNVAFHRYFFKFTIQIFYRKVQARIQIKKLLQLQTWTEHLVLDLEKSQEKEDPK